MSHARQSAGGRWLGAQFPAPLRGASAPAPAAGSRAAGAAGVGAAAPVRRRVRVVGGWSRSSPRP
ncbi:hypothetical protein DD630_13010 [Streptomyces sp. BSE7F]|nr:hypothetical protein DD630_13010 [Streptomyces sp. BSE7F]